jgi:hypothetical protein
LLTPLKLFEFALGQLVDEIFGHDAKRLHRRLGSSVPAGEETEVVLWRKVEGQEGGESTSE